MSENLPLSISRARVLLDLVSQWLQPGLVLASAVAQARQSMAVYHVTRSREDARWRSAAPAAVG
jgi:hypothetical protein